MIDYETAKQLKEAGFIADWDALQVFPYKKDKDEYYLPTLEELIEACGDKFETLIRIVNEDLTTKHWLAHAFGLEQIPQGETAIHAMSNLYLELNKNANN